MPVLSLAHFTVLDAAPLDLIEVGAAAGFTSVGLRIVQPPGAPAITPVIGDAALQRLIKAKLKATGMRILDTEAIWLLAETDVAALHPALETAAELGAAYMVVNVNDPDRGRVLDGFGRLCGMGHASGVRVMLEFLPYTELKTLHDAHAFLRDAAPRDAGILVDALHLSRSGGQPSDLAAYDPALFSVAHLCDAPRQAPPPDEMRAEARTNRLYPGDGGLWLEDFVRAFGPATSFAVEAPSREHAALPAVARAKLAAAKCRALLARSGRVLD